MAASSIKRSQPSLLYANPVYFRFKFLLINFLEAKRNIAFQGYIEVWDSLNKKQVPRWEKKLMTLMYFLTIAFPTPSFKHILNNILFIVIYRSSGFQPGNQRKSCQILDRSYEIQHPIPCCWVCFLGHLILAGGDNQLTILYLFKKKKKK